MTANDRTAWAVSRQCIGSIVVMLECGRDLYDAACSGRPAAGPDTIQAFRELERHSDRARALLTELTTRQQWRPSDEELNADTADGRMMDLRRANTPVGAIADDLNAHGLPTPRGKLWSPAGVAQRLTALGMGGRIKTRRRNRKETVRP